MASAAAAAPAPYAPPPEHLEDDVDDEYRPVKEFTVFLVDAGAAMLQPCYHHLLLPHPHPRQAQAAVEGVSPTDSWLDVAVKVVRETLAAKIVAAPTTDEAAVVFYGPRVARGPAPDDEAQVWTFNLGLEGRRNARAGGAAGGGVPTAALAAAATAAATARARATAVARQAHDASGIDFPSADLLRALAELVGDGDGGEGGGRGNRARERLFVARGGNGPGTNDTVGKREDSFGASVEALLLALRRASTLLSAATRGKRPGNCARRVVVLSCQPLAFRSLFAPAPAPGGSPLGSAAPRLTAAPSPAPFLAAPSDAAAAAATFAAAASSAAAAADSGAARRLAAQFRSALRERGTILGGACASLELVALEPLSAKRSAMAGGAVEEEAEEEGKRGGGGGRGGSSAASDFYGDAGQQRTAWGELLLASAAATRRESDDANERAIKAARHVAEEELRQQQQQQRRQRGGANGTEQQSQQQQLLVATLRLKQLQREAEAARVAELADDAALSLAVTRFSGVSRAARSKVYKRSALSTYLLLLPGGSGSGDGEGGSEPSAVACAVSLYQNLRKAWYASAETVSLRDYALLERESRLVPVGGAAAAAAARGLGGGAAAADGDAGLLLSDGPSAAAAGAARAAAGAGGAGAGEGGAVVGAWRLGGERAGAAAVARRAAAAALDAEGGGWDRSAALAEMARKTVAGGVVEFSAEELAKVKCVGVPLEEGEEMETGGTGGEEERRAAAVAAGLCGLNRSRREDGGGGDGEHDDREGEEGDDDDDEDGLPSASSPSFIEVLGFVPVSMIDPRRLQRSPSFLYPNERFAKGSTAVFSSLWWAMLGEGDEEGEEEVKEEEEEGAAPAAAADGSPERTEKTKKSTGPVAALATFVRQRGRPQLVALVPHALVEDAAGTGEQLEPPGLDVVYLPAADEVRPAAAPNAGASPGSQASQLGPPPYLAAGDAAVSAAERLVRGLCLDEPVAGEKRGGGGSEDVVAFDSAEISNPALARFYSVLEALALGEAAPPAESAVDGTMPSREAAERAVGLARGLAEAVGGALDDGEDGGGGAGAGGGGGGGGGGASARARRGGDREATVAEIEADALSGLDLKVEEVQRALVARKLKKSGRKEELLQRLRGAMLG